MASPNKPVLSLERNGWEIDLSWRPISNSQGTKIERKREDESSYTLTATISGGDTDYQDMVSDITLSYSYRIKAFNTDGDSLYSNTVISDGVNLMSVYTYAVSGNKDNFIVLEDAWVQALSGGS